MKEKKAMPGNGKTPFEKLRDLLIGTGVVH